MGAQADAWGSGRAIVFGGAITASIALFVVEENILHDANRIELDAAPILAAQAVLAASGLLAGLTASRAGSVGLGSSAGRRTGHGRPRLRARLTITVRPLEGSPASLAEHDGTLRSSRGRGEPGR